MCIRDRHNDISSLVDGTIVHNFFPLEFNANDYAIYELIPFVEEGYSFPTADSLEVGMNELYWASPTELGTYAFAIRAHEYRWDGSKNFKLGTKTRYMMIDIDSSMLVPISNIVATNDFQIYPNPTSGEVNIKFDYRLLEDDFTVRVINIFGQTVYQETIHNNKNEKQLNLNNHPDGPYYLSLQSGTKIITKKIIIHH